MKITGNKILITGGVICPLQKKEKIFTDPGGKGRHNNAPPVS